MCETHKNVINHTSQEYNNNNTYRLHKHETFDTMSPDLHNIHQ